MVGLSFTSAGPGKGRMSVSHRTANIKDFEQLSITKIISRRAFDDDDDKMFISPF